MGSLTTMFRLDFSGDFDFGDMEGVNPTITGSITKKTLDQWTINSDFNNAEPQPIYSHGVIVLYMVCTVVINILFLNVYIGILSNQYDKYYEDRSSHFSQFRLDYTYRLLSRRAMMDHFREKYCGCWCPKKPETEKPELVWIAYRVDYESYREKLLKSDLGVFGSDDTN